MDKKEKIIIIMLILAILFSILSIIISLSNPNVSIPKGNASYNGGGKGSGDIKLFVEGNGGNYEAG